MYEYDSQLSIDVLILAVEISILAKHALLIVNWLTIMAVVYVM